MIAVWRCNAPLSIYSPRCQAEVILALDTSGEVMVLCVLPSAPDEGDGTRSLILPAGAGAALVEAISSLVVSGAPSLDRLAVVRGPGSFTGLRAGMGTAAGIAFARRLPIHPLSSLAVAAHRAAGETRVLAAVNAGRGRCFFQAFAHDGESWKASGERGLDTIEAAAHSAGQFDCALIAEPALLERLQAAGGTTAAVTRTSAEALAAAARRAVEVDPPLAYDELTGDYQ